MKRLLGLLILTAFAAVSASAQISADIAATYAHPLGSFADGYTLGYGAKADVFVMLPSMPSLGVGASVGLTRFSLDEDIAEDGHLSMLEVLPSARYLFTPPDSQFGFFGQAGFGLYRGTASIGDPQYVGDADHSSSDMGFCAGAGVSGKFADAASLVVMPMFHYVNTESEATKYLAPIFGVLFSAGVDGGAARRIRLGD